MNQTPNKKPIQSFPLPDTDPAQMFAQYRVLYAYIGETALFHSPSLEDLRAGISELTEAGNPPAAETDASNYYAIERDRESHIVVHNIHASGVRTGEEISADLRAQMLAELQIGPGGTGEAHA